MILCVLRPRAREVPEGIAWDGRILVDATNAHVDEPPDISPEGVIRSRAALAETGRTASDLVAEWAPGARPVESIGNLPVAWIQDFSAPKPRTVLFTSGDDADAGQAGRSNRCTTD